MHGEKSGVKGIGKRGGFYYVDKTLLIRDLLDHPAMVTLITRPRRFGKTLNMSMLQAFFETGSGGKEFFEKLNIWKCGEAYTRHCEAYPVISLSLKDVKGDDWDSMYAQFCTVIRNEVGRLEAKGMLAGERQGASRSCSLMNMMCRSMRRTKRDIIKKRWDSKRPGFQQG